MAQQTSKIPISSIILDEDIYPRKGIDHRRVGIFSENLRDGNDPLLYAATKAIGPKQLTEDEARDTARRAYSGNSRLSSADIGKAIGRSRQTVDTYVADLRAATQMGRDIKIFRMNRLGIPQDRISERLGLVRTSLIYHLSKMPVLANSTNADLRVTFRLSRGFTVAQVAIKHGWTEPMVWSLALEGKNDTDRFKELGWGLRTWDQWEFNSFGISQSRMT